MRLLIDDSFTRQNNTDLVLGGTNTQRLIAVIQDVFLTRQSSIGYRFTEYK